MKITYFLRNAKIGFSIQKVFGTIISEIGKNNEVNTVYMPNKGSMPLDVIKNGLYSLNYRNIANINHITGHIHDLILFLWGSKTVLTIHDLVFLDNVKNPIKWVYKWLFWLYIPVKLANKVTCISEKTKERVLKYIKTDKLVVIHNPIDPAFAYSPKVFNYAKPVILHLGTGWNKNLKRTIVALSGISCHLRIVGKVSEEVKSLLDSYSVEYSSVFGLSDEEVLSEYKKSDIVNFPTEYEGFGMPVIEGQAVGRVVLCSRISPLTEISGDAVHYVDPLDINSLRAGYLELINDEEYRNKLIGNGIVNAKKFNVESIARQYLEVYKSIKNKP
jgi:glycosyltransferase involved in cell wall biosynthesis